MRRHRPRSAMRGGTAALLQNTTLQAHMQAQHTHSRAFAARTLHGRGAAGARQIRDRESAERPRAGQQLTSPNTACNAAAPAAKLSVLPASPGGSNRSSGVHKGVCVAAAPPWWRHNGSGVSGTHGKGQVGGCEAGHGHGQSPLHCHSVTPRCAWLRSPPSHTQCCRWTVSSHAPSGHLHHHHHRGWGGRPPRGLSPPPKGSAHSPGNTHIPQAQAQGARSSTTKGVFGYSNGHPPPPPSTDTTRHPAASPAPAAAGQASGRPLCSPWACVQTAGPGGARARLLGGP